MSDPLFLHALCPIALELDLDIDTSRQVETHERVDGVGRRVEDVDEALVRAHLELLAGVLVHMGPTDDAVQVALRRQRNRTGNLGTRLLCGIDDETRGLIHDLMIVTLQADANTFFSHLTYLHYGVRT